MTVLAAGLWFGLLNACPRSWFSPYHPWAHLVPGPQGKVVELWVGSEGSLLCILGLPAQVLPHFVLRQAYVTTWPGQAGHDSQPHFVPPLSLQFPSPTELLLADFLKLQV